MFILFFVLHANLLCELSPIWYVGMGLSSFLMMRKLKLEKAWTAWVPLLQWLRTGKHSRSVQPALEGENHAPWKNTPVCRHFEFRKQRLLPPVLVFLLARSSHHLLGDVCPLGLGRRLPCVRLLCSLQDIQALCLRFCQRSSGSVGFIDCHRPCDLPDPLLQEAMLTR